MLKKIKMFRKLFKKDKKTAIEKYKELNDILITFKDLSEIPIGKTIQMIEETPGAIEYTRINSIDEESLMFTVSMTKGHIWEKHHHDCIETCVIYKGELADILTGKIVKRGGTLRIKPYQIHHIIANADSVFYVEFQKPKI